MSHLWLRRTKIIEPREAMPMAGHLAGRFKMEAVRPDGRVRLLADWFPNLITDAGLNAIGTVSNWLQFCRVGTGSATPNVADTAMGTLVAGTGTIQASSGTAESTTPYVGRRTKTFRFAAGAAAGNLTEVGISTQAAAGGTQFSRALILDGDANPTVITVLSDEVLDVTYELQLIVPPSDVIDTITIDGIDYDTTTRAADASTAASWATGGDTGGIHVLGEAHSGTIGAITATPGGTSATSTSVTPSSYSNNSLFREGTLTWGLSAANFGADGVRSIDFSLGSGGGMGRMQVAFANGDSPTKGIPKTSSTVLSLVCRHTWARGTPI